jgi:hypothetical protein
MVDLEKQVGPGSIFLYFHMYQLFFQHLLEIREQ